ncbi:hypothetical protein GEMRC1_006211 [Eukaryota sp. GEM-RC1]
MATPLAKAEAHYRDGSSALKTSLFKWKPEHQSAAMHFERAATSFKVAKDFPKAIDAFKKSALSHSQTGIHYSAGKNLELAASLATKLNDHSESVTLYLDASLEYGLSDNLAARIKALAKAAEAQVAAGAQDEAVSTYKEAFDLSLSEELTKRLVIDSVVTPLVNLLLKGQKYEECAQFLIQLNNYT